MKNRSNLSQMFSHNRRLMYIALCVVMLLVFTLTVVYAALSTTLNINGNAEVSSASWDIYLDNVELNISSITSDVPVISDRTTASFTTTLNKPGDFYEFTIDVVNNGTIDAMIDSVIKTPELTIEQAKYLNYIVEYQNGQAITAKQLVEKNSFVRLKVKVEYRKDISAVDLPLSSETLDLSFTVKYVQSDESSTTVTGNGVKKSLNVVSGDLDTVGSEVSIENEHFYIISSDEESITMLTKYNLYVGGKYENSVVTAYGNEATGLQDSTMLGKAVGQAIRNGIIEFSSRKYWQGRYYDYPDAYVYESNSTLYNHVENYKTYLVSQGLVVEEARLIKNEELVELGCDLTVNKSCRSAPSWVYGTTYWTGTASDDMAVWYVYNSGIMAYNSCTVNNMIGLRPVIKIVR